MISPDQLAPARCNFKVSVRDTYRHIGGKAHFKMHYKRRRCKRKIKCGEKFCWQHQEWQDTTDAWLELEL